MTRTRLPAWRGMLLACSLMTSGIAANAGSTAMDAGWFESGDVELRLDLTLLNDANVIRLPISHWPLPRAAVRHAMESAREHFAVNAAVKLALDRVRARLDGRPRYRVEAGASAGKSGLLRDFNAIGREDFELTGKVDYDSGRFAGALRATAVASPDDRHEFRADGSHLTAQFGNWLISANTLERFWGPSHESSLILSNNARPMPTIMVERATALPFESKWLSWMGPWRFNFGISRMEEHRRDIDAPLFMAWRVAIMPFDSMELGFSRTAQFCGKQLVCDLNSFGNMLAGNDNVGIDATKENEPGNQMAGFDIRWHSPIGNLPYAVYAQMIGEDESSYLPVKYLNQYGIEGWKTFTRGGVLQLFAEYSSTTCSANTARGPYYDCAYNQGRFSFDGYRYRGRVVGHTTDSDAENWSVGAKLLMPRGDQWAAVARTSQLNHDGFDIRDTVSAGPTSYEAIELGWSGERYGARIDLQVGAQSVEPKYGDRDIEPFGFVRYTREFMP